MNKEVEPASWRRSASIALVAATIVLASCSALHGEHSRDTNTPTNSSVSQLRELGSYEEALNHTFEHEMLFISTPQTESEATERADALAKTLHQYAKYDIKPLIVMEPADNSDNLDLETLTNATSLHALQTFFGGLKERGITDEEMGTLVLFPEADLPDWGSHSTDPKLFAHNYAAAGAAYKSVFHDGKLSILLDSAAYPSGDVNHKYGSNKLEKLEPYVQALRSIPGMPAIDSIGFQGFPWSVTDQPQDYLNADVAEKLASELGVRHIWFNTGTAESYEGKSVSPLVRRSQLLGELAMAASAKSHGYNVQVNVFAGEDTDVSWKYPLAEPNTVGLLSDFVNKATAEGIDPELFVTTN